MIGDENDFIPGFDDPDDELSGYFDDDGNKLNPELVVKPSLCILCANDDDPNQKVMCTLTRFDQTEDGDFSCSAFRKRG